MLSPRLLMILGVTSMVAVGCGSTLPKELVDARSAYQRASTGPAAQLNPAQLLVAQQALQIAEKTYEDEGDSNKTRDRAYVATRKAETAEAQARIAELDRSAAEAAKRAEANRSAQIGNMQNQLASTKDQLAAQQQALAAERQAREEAERRAKEAADALAKVAAVKQEPRGMVITLSGSVLFASGKSELLPAAQAKLNDVAGVLAKQSPDQKLIVEGHTDSQGSAALNQTLSQKRAESVRSYLTTHGVDPTRIVAEGKGPAQPIADNASAEGRANNRRVEIIIQPSQQGANTNSTNPNTPPAH